MGNLENFIRTWVIDMSRHVLYCRLEAKWLSAQQFDTMHRLPEQTFFAYN